MPTVRSHPLVTPPTVGPPVPGQIVRCLGCATLTVHQCAGARELVPYGGTCQCPDPGCGPNPELPAGRTVRSRRRR